MSQELLAGFEKFVRKGKSYRPKLSIRSRGQMGFNNGAVKRFGLEKYDFAVLYFSKEKNQIAIRLATKSEEGSSKIIKKSGNFFISGLAFLDCYQVNHQETKNYDIEAAGEDILLVNLARKTEEDK
jgi:hypothetical protein